MIGFLFEKSHIFHLIDKKWKLLLFHWHCDRFGALPYLCPWVILSPCNGYDCIHCRIRDDGYEKISYLFISWKFFSFFSSLVISLTLRPIWRHFHISVHEWSSLLVMATIAFSAILSYSDLDHFWSQFYGSLIGTTFEPHSYKLGDLSFVRWTVHFWIAEITRESKTWNCSSQPSSIHALAE